MEGRQGATKWWMKATSSLKQPNGICWSHFHPHMSHKAAKSMAKLISQLCGESQLAICLSREDGAISRAPSTCECQQAGKETWVKYAVGPLIQALNGNEKCVLKLCMYNTLFVNLATYSYIATHHDHESTMYSYLYTVSNCHNKTKEHNM